MSEKSSKRKASGRFWSLCAGKIRPDSHSLHDFSGRTFVLRGSQKSSARKSALASFVCAWGNYGVAAVARVCEKRLEELAFANSVYLRGFYGFHFICASSAETLSF